MPFIFANASALWLLPAVTLPIIFHLFFRLQKQLQDFPTLMFFLQIDPRLSAKRKIHEWLILLLRTLLISAIILALARPSTGLVSLQGGVARLIIIDNSGSMAQPTTQPGISKLRLACQSAQLLLANTHSGDSTAVQLMVPDPIAALPTAFDASDETIRDELAKLEPTDSAPSIPRALRTALATLKNAKQSTHEIHIITDLETKNWNTGQIGTLSGQARFIVHGIETAPLKTPAVSLDVVDAPTRSIPSGRIVPIRFMLMNRSKEKAHVRLNATDDSGKNATQEIALDSNQSVPASLTFTFTSPGFHWANAWIEGDTTTSATSASLGFWCTDVAKAIFVGNRQDFGALPFAVAPGGSPELSGIETLFVAPEQLTDQLTGSPPLAVVVTWKNWPDCPLLQSYIENGGTLFVVPLADATAVSPNRAPPPGWLDASAGSTAPPIAKSGEPIAAIHADDPIWRDMRNSQGQPSLGLLLAFHENPMQIGKAWLPLITSAHGSNLFARREMGRGRLFASGLAFTPSWSSLPTKAGFVVMIQNTFFGRKQEQIPINNATAGEDVLFDSANASTSIRSLAGSPLQWQGEPGQFAGLPRAGVYEITQGTKTEWISTCGNPDETVPEYLPVGSVPPLIQSLNPESIALQRPEDILVDPKTQASGTPLYGAALVAALLLIFLETWVANSKITGLKTRTRSYARS